MIVKNFKNKTSEITEINVELVLLTNSQRNSYQYGTWMPPENYLDEVKQVTVNCLVAHQFLYYGPSILEYLC